MPNLRGRIQPLDEEAWRAVGDHCKHIKHETARLYKMIQKHVPVSVLDKLLKVDKDMDIVRFKLENVMMERTEIRDTHIFYPWQEDTEGQ